MKKEFLTIYVAFFRNVKLALSEDIKELRKFLERPCFSMLFKEIEIEKLKIEGNLMFEDEIEEIMIVNIGDKLITLGEYRLLKREFEYFVNGLVDTRVCLIDLLSITSDKASVKNTIKEIDNVLNDSANRLEDYIINHKLLYCNDISEYIRMVKDLNNFGEFN